MREGLERLYRGYALALASAVLSFLPYAGVAALVLAGIATYFIYTGFKRLSEVSEKYRPGKRGVLLVFAGTLMASLSLLFQPLALIAFAVILYGTLEYFRGLWALGELEGGKPVRLGVALAAATVALSLAAALYPEGRLALLLAAQFSAGASAVLTLLGVREVLERLPEGQRF
ncbi:MAG: hypothetical protein GXO07_05810 [Crenarchaeota archaeon]|nr:hypothetical protein [Thermoproteota archaeon]